MSKLREHGVEIRAIELSNSPAELDAVLKGVDTVISTTFITEIDKQVRLADAAKRVGVKRFIPNDWATPCVRGLRKMFDQVRTSNTFSPACHVAYPRSQKAAIHDYVKSIGLGYTFIDAGLW